LGFKIGVRRMEKLNSNHIANLIKELSGCDFCKIKHTQEVEFAIVGWFFAVQKKLKSASQVSESPNSGEAPTDNNRMPSALQINHALKNIESDEQRLNFLSDILDGICCYCGSVTDRCYCTRDD
jgi:hypothetical protein